MLKLDIPESSGEPLFEATLEPAVTAVDKLVKSRDIGEGDIITVQGKVNKVAVGEPYHENLISRYIAEDKEISHEIKQMLPNYDFHFVSLSCSFLPDPACRFTWVRFGVKLSARLKSGEQHKEKPIAWSIFPDEILSEIKYMREVILTPELTLKSGVANVGMKLFDVKTQQSFIAYEPQILSFGIRRSSMSWDFKTTKEKGIWGNKKDLLLIVRAPKNSEIKGRFLLAAEVKFHIGRWIPIPLSKRKDKLVDNEYDLSK